MKTDTRTTMTLHKTSETSPTRQLARLKQLDSRWLARRLRRLINATPTGRKPRAR